MSSSVRARQQFSEWFETAIQLHVQQNINVHLIFILFGSGQKKKSLSSTGRIIDMGRLPLYLTGTSS